MRELAFRWGGRQTRWRSARERRTKIQIGLDEEFSSKLRRKFLAEPANSSSVCFEVILPALHCNNGRRWWNLLGALALCEWATQSGLQGRPNATALVVSASDCDPSAAERSPKHTTLQTWLVIVHYRRKWTHLRSKALHLRIKTCTTLLDFLYFIIRSLASEQQFEWPGWQTKSLKDSTTMYIQVSVRKSASFHHWKQTVGLPCIAPTQTHQPEWDNKTERECIPPNLQQ